MWNLENIFKNENEFYECINEVKIKVEEIKRYKDVKIDEKSLLEMLNEKWTIKELANKILVYGSLSYYKNIDSENCIKLKSDAEEIDVFINAELNFIDRKILECDNKKVDSFLKKNAGLKVYELYLNNLFRKEKHVPKDEVEKVISDNTSKMNLEINKYNELLRNIDYGEIEINGENVQININNFIKFLTSKDRHLREQVYLKVNESFKNKSSEFSNILDALIRYRIENSNHEGYQSVLEKVLHDDNIDFKIVDSLIKSVNNNLGFLQKYLQFRARIVGIENPHLYDFGVPIEDDLNIKFSIEEAIKIIKEALKPLGDKYLEVVDYLLDGHVDYLCDEAKHQSITFSWNSYSFMNFRGRYNDLKNLIHELGHIVNYYLSSKKQPFIYADSTIFVGEISSLVNEILLNRYLYEHAKNESEKIFYLNKGLENFFTTVYKQMMYTELEVDLYQTRLGKELTQVDFSEKYIALVKKYYGDDIVYDEVANIEWCRLGHLYRWSFYPFKYANGLIIANIVVDSLVNKSLRVDDYQKFLEAGSSLYPLDILKILKVDLSDLKMISDGFNIFKSDLNYLEELVQKD